MKPVLLTFLIFILLCGWDFVPISNAQLYEKNNTNSYLTSLQILEKYGYPAEAHMVTTEDDYILELHRIPHGKNPEAPKRGIPVLIQHGFLGSSADFLLIEPEKGLPFLLADNGYDVWMGNVRGNTYSRGHKTLTPSDKKFWDFSWHESGFYDLPAQIDFICNYTKNDDILYIGYSMGTTMFFVMASSRPEYQQKIRGAFLLAAVAYLQHARSPIRVLAPLADDVQFISKILTDGELIQQSSLYRRFVRLACTLNSAERHLCRDIIFLLTGSDPRQFNETLLQSILNHLPAGSSTKTLTHFAQLILSGEFCEFNYGTKENIVRYNSPVPPKYNLESINTAVYLFEGPNDFLSTKKDVHRLIQRLPNVKSVDVVDFPQFNHLDFLFANDVKTLLYDNVLQSIENLLVATDNNELGYLWD